MPADAARAVEEVYRSDWGRIVATLIGITRDFDLAEESAQEAFTAAVDQWRESGVPEFLRVDHTDGPAQGHRPHTAPGAVEGEAGIVRRRWLGARHRRAGLRQRRNPRRSASPDLHLLPPGAGTGGAGGVDPAHAVRPGDGRDRAGVSSA